ncbi:MAG: helix-hairpin-helix domain-containing protein [Thermoanaerobacteraceae bacterium]|nr:helix-hairpin-helix domain-containing protein [Thermoanaerobacteraceae bacterium]
MEDKRVQYALLILLLALVVGAAIKLVTPNQPVVIQETQGKMDTADGQPAERDKEIAIHVVGAVKYPGVYYLQSGNRVIDAVNLAKPLPEADINRLPLAKKVVDGQTIQVPRIGDNFGESAQTAGKDAKQPESGKISINNANQKQLETLPGIGEVYAKRIIEYRETHGGFKTLEELKEVSGIGDKTFEKLKDLITL